MQLLERPSILRRGAAPPNERKTAVFLAVAAAIHIALSNSFGLGGNNACLVLGRYLNGHKS